MREGLPSPSNFPAPLVRELQPDEDQGFHRALPAQMPLQQAERNRDLEIATCPANYPEAPKPLQSRFLNRGSFPYAPQSGWKQPSP